jgi:Fe-coproporphyrin III synthase
MQHMLAALLAKVGRAFRTPELVLPYLRYQANGLRPRFDPSGRSWPPRRIFLGVNSVCSERCVMCDFGQRATDRMFFQNLRPTVRSLELPLERLKTLVDEVAPFRPIIEAHTVEPTLYRDLPALATYATQAGLPFRVFTSGARLAQLADDLVAANVDQIYVSIDGPPTIHDTIRGVPGAFTRAYRGIEAVQAARARYPGSRTKVRINATISEYNAAHLVELVESVKDLEVACVMFMHLNFVSPEMAAVHNALYGHICTATPLGVGAVDPERIDVQVLADQLQQLQRRYPAWYLHIQPGISAASTLQAYYREPARFLHGQRCTMPWQTAMVIADGSVIVRNRCYHVVFGNIFEEPLLAIWNGERFRSFRRALRTTGVFPACARCYGAFRQ